MKRGFTLVELLAVIVILAIIALIAVPVVLNIIRDSRESSKLRSVEFYISALENSIATSKLHDVNIENGTYEVMKSGNICIGTLTDNTCDGDELQVEVKGDIPDSGSITIVDGQIDEVSFVYGTNIIVNDSKGNLVYQQKLVSHIKELYKPTKTVTLNNIEYSLDETNSLMNDRFGSSLTLKDDGNIRYYGANPNNYIDIGDRDSSGNIIFWRIIGLFKDVEVVDENGNVTGKEDLVKIIRANRLTTSNVQGFAWDLKSDGTYNNDWTNSTLQAMLNDAYYNSNTTTYYSKTDGQIQLNFASTGLSADSRSKIENVNWNIISHNSTGVYTDVMYNYESEKGSLVWPGKVALMYASDYGYAANLISCQTTPSAYNTDNCKKSNWLLDTGKSQWNLPNYSINTVAAFAIKSSGEAQPSHTINNPYGVFPVMYLKSDVSIVEEAETNKGLKYLVIE